MIVRVPGLTPAGAVCDEIVELVDLLPTIGELAGFDVPDNVEGTSFVPLLADPNKPWKKGALTVFGNKGEHNSLRTKRFRYCEWEHQGELIKELYDLEQDPWETVNLADQPATAVQQQELAELLDAGWQKLLPPN